MMKYPILQRNLAELESKIRSILAESDNNRCRLQYVASSDEIERKFVFLKNQFAAELSTPTPHTDHHLSHLSTRLDNLHAAFARVSHSVLYDQPLGSDYLDAPSACSCTDSCLDDGDDENEDEDQVEDKVEEVDQSGSGVFKAYDNPCWDFGSPDEVEVEDEDRSAVIHEPVSVEEECFEGFAGAEKATVRDHGGYCGDYWRGLLIGVLSGAVATVASVLAVVVPYGVRCRFDDAVSGVLFPPPT